MTHHKTRAQQRIEELDATPATLAADLEAANAERDEARSEGRRIPRGAPARARRVPELQAPQRRGAAGRAPGWRTRASSRKVLAIADDFDRAIDARPERAGGRRVERRHRGHRPEAPAAAGERGRGRDRCDARHTVRPAPARGGRQRARAAAGATARSSRRSGAAIAFASASSARRSWPSRAAARTRRRPPTTRTRRVASTDPKAKHRTPNQTIQEHGSTMAKIIGIDLGTTNSVVAVMEGGEPDRHPVARRAVAPSRPSSRSPRPASGSSASWPSARP